MIHRYNPYTVGPPVEHENFYGRQALLDTLWSQQTRIVHLLGMRRIGKTSVLKKLCTMGKAVYLDLQAVGDWAEFADVLREQLFETQTEFPWLSPGEIQETSDLFSLLKLLDRCFQRAGASLCVLLDEAEGLINLGQADLKALRKFQSLLRHVKALQFVFASAKNLTELDELTEKSPGYGSPFLNEFPPPLYIGGLDRATALALIRQSQNPPAMPIADDLAETIYHCTNGHPYLIQWVCSSLWTKNPDPTTWQISEHTFKASLDVQRILRKDFNYLSDPERQIIRAVLTQQSLSSAAPFYLEGLMALGYLRQVDEGYEIGNDFFKNWLLDLAQQDWELSSHIAAEATRRLYEKSAEL